MDQGLHLVLGKDFVLGLGLSFGDYFSFLVYILDVNRLCLFSLKVLPRSASDKIRSRYSRKLKGSSKNSCLAPVILSQASCLNTSIVVTWMRSGIFLAVCKIHRAVYRQAGDSPFVCLCL